ncbi:hypothetical protein LEN26_008778 [Aphanomyces euteiches]|nr:hypothetical protein LEN26_008778 [Aphanomyces euteiches]
MYRYTTDATIAHALYGQVLLCTDTLTGENVAIKRMNLDAAASRRLFRGGSYVLFEDITTEKLVNHALSAFGGHPNILRLRDDFVQDGYDHFVLDYCDGGELFDIRISLTERFCKPSIQLPFCSNRKFYAKVRSNGMISFHVLRCSIQLTIRIIYIMRIFCRPFAFFVWTSRSLSMVLALWELALLSVQVKTDRQRRVYLELCAASYIERPVIPNVRFDINKVAIGNSRLDFRFSVVGIKKLGYLLGLPAVIITTRRYRVLRDIRLFAAKASSLPSQ